jgi:hypothetical protein
VGIWKDGQGCTLGNNTTKSADYHGIKTIVLLQGPTIESFLSQRPGVPRMFDIEWRRWSANLRDDDDDDDDLQQQFYQGQLGIVNTLPLCPTVLKAAGITAAADDDVTWDAETADKICEKTMQFLGNCFPKLKYIRACGKLAAYALKFLIGQSPGSTDLQYSKVQHPSSFFFRGVSLVNHTEPQPEDYKESSLTRENVRDAKRWVKEYGQSNEASEDSDDEDEVPEDEGGSNGEDDDHSEMHADDIESCRQCFNEICKRIRKDESCRSDDWSTQHMLFYDVSESRWDKFRREKGKVEGRRRPLPVGHARRWTICVRPKTLKQVLEGTQSWLCLWSLLNEKYGIEELRYEEDRGPADARLAKAGIRRYKLVLTRKTRSE